MKTEAHKELNTSAILVLLTQNKRNLRNLKRHIERKHTGEDNILENNPVKTCQLCQIATQHKCRLCKKNVCNIFCSIQDPSSDNEAHRIHKHGDTRCFAVDTFYCSECQNIYDSAEDLNMHQEIAHAESFTSNSEEEFECPSCDKGFSTASDLEKHIEARHAQISSLALISSASSESWMYVSCDICAMKLQNDADLRNHQIGVHSYLECQSCGKIFSTPTKHKKHLSESHAEFSFSSDLEDLGVEKLPVYSRRIKQTFTGLVIDEAGSNEGEDSDDDFQETSDNIFREDEIHKKNLRKRKVTESLIPNKR